MIVGWLTGESCFAGDKLKMADIEVYYGSCSDFTRANETHLEFKIAPALLTDSNTPSIELCLPLKELEDVLRKLAAAEEA